MQAWMEGFAQLVRGVELIGRVVTLEDGSLLPAPSAHAAPHLSVTSALLVDCILPSFSCLDLFEINLGTSAILECFPWVGCGVVERLPGLHRPGL